MKASFDPQFDSQFNALADDSSVLAYSGQDGATMGARASVVNRTHRVVRERATVMQERRSHARSLMVPLAICSALLILLVVVVWSGLYSEAAEAGRRGGAGRRLRVGHDRLKQPLSGGSAVVCPVLNCASGRCLDSPLPP